MNQSEWNFIWNFKNDTFAIIVIVHWNKNFVKDIFGIIFPTIVLLFAMFGTCSLHINFDQLFLLFNCHLIINSPGVNQMNNNPLVILCCLFIIYLDNSWKFGWNIVGKYTLDSVLWPHIELFLKTLFIYCLRYYYLK